MTDCVTKATCRAAETRDTAVWDAGNRHADSWDGARRFMSSPWLLALGLIAAGTMARLAFRDLPNFAPVAALALFAGYYFRCWLTMEFYAKTGAGLLQCYIQALPFFRYTLIGDLVFSVGLFAAYTLAVSLGWSRATGSVAVATAAVNR